MQFSSSRWHYGTKTADYLDIIWEGVFQDANSPSNPFQSSLRQNQEPLRSQINTEKT